MTELTKELREAIEWAAGRAYGESKCQPPESIFHRRWRALSDLHRAYHAEQSADIPAGCTPADARNLREANQQMAQEVHELRVDAERYRVLRKPGAPIDGTVFACVYVHVPGTIPSQKVVVGDELDRVCDAARTGASE